MLGMKCGHPHSCVCVHVRVGVLTEEVISGEQVAECPPGETKASSEDKHIITSGIQPD